MTFSRDYSSPIPIDPKETTEILLHHPFAGIEIIKKT